VLLTDLDSAAVTSAAPDWTVAARSAPPCWTSRTTGGRGDVPTASTRYGRINNVISRAAIITANRALDITPDHWQRVLSINLVGTFSVCQQSIRRMAAQRFGCIVAVASDAGKRGGGLVAVADSSQRNG